MSIQKKVTSLAIFSATTIIFSANGAENSREQTLETTAPIAFEGRVVVGTPDSFPGTIEVDATNPLLPDTAIPCASTPVSSDRKFALTLEDCTSLSPGFALSFHFYSNTDRLNSLGDAFVDMNQKTETGAIEVNINYITTQVVGAYMWKNCTGTPGRTYSDGFSYISSLFPYTTPAPDEQTYTSYSQITLLSDDEGKKLIYDNGTTPFGESLKAVCTK